MATSPGVVAGGFCAGRLARIGVSLERATRWLDVWAQKLDFGVQHLAFVVNSKAPQLLTALAKLQAREQVLRTLRDTSLDHASVVERLTKILEQAQEKVRMANSGAAIAEVESPAKWARLAAEEWTTCRAVAKNEPSYCEQLRSLDESASQKCLWFFVRTRILYAGRCDDSRGLRLAARAVGLTEATIKKVCLAIANSRAEECLALIDPFGRTLCQAMAGRSDAVCDAESMSPKQRQDCRDEYEFFLAIRNGHASANHIRFSSDNYLLVGMAALEVDIDCAEVTVSKLEQLTPLWSAIVGL